MSAEVLENLLSYFPCTVSAAIREAERSRPSLPDTIGEIRLRAGRCVALTVGGENLLLPVTVGKEELQALLSALTHGSLYAHREELVEGFISLDNGVRVGVAGRAVQEGREITAVTDITSLAFRIPHRIPSAGAEAERVFRAAGGCGLLVFSPPGGGKTTLLCDLARRLSEGVPPLRVALVDSRGELSAGGYGRGAMIDILKGYPKARGIEQAVRTLSPEVVIVDEIGSRREAEAILSASLAGVPIVATAHAATLKEATARPAVLPLLRAGVFGRIIGLYRTKDAVRAEIYTSPYGSDTKGGRRP